MLTIAIENRNDKQVDELVNEGANLAVAIFENYQYYRQNHDYSYARQVALEYEDKFIADLYDFIDREEMRFSLPELEEFFGDPLMAPLAEHFLEEWAAGHNEDKSKYRYIAKILGL